MIVGRIYLGKTEIYEAYRNGVLIWQSAMKMYGSGQMFSDLLFLVGAGLEVREPDAIRMCFQQVTANIANGTLQNPEAVLLMGWDDAVNTASAELRVPDRILLVCWDGAVNTAYAETQAPEPLFLICWDAMTSVAGAKLTAPERLRMFLWDKMTGTANVREQSVADILMYIRDLAVNIAAPKTQTPEDLFLSTLFRNAGRAWGRNQVPESVLLAMIENMANRASPSLFEPDNILLYLDGRGITGQLDPELRRPDELRMDVEMGSHGSAAADLETPTKVLMIGRTEMLNKAGAIRVNLHPMKVYSAGEGWLWLRGFLHGQEETPLDILGSMAFAMSITAGGHPAETTPGAGVLFLPDLMGIASGHPAWAVPGAGVAYLSHLHGFADGHPAKAIPSAGQPIEFVFTCRMWGNAAVGAVVIVRMHTTLGDVIGLADGHPAQTIPSDGVGEVSPIGGFADPSMEVPENIFAHAKAGNVFGRGSYSSLRGSVPSAGVIFLEELRGRAGGYIMQVGEASDWVTQTGTNLYIQGIWSGWPVDGTLYIGDFVFLDPVRDGSDLYIRSVNKIWLDGDEANIDKEFFLDPIQTGSNLYIRQDVLGG